MSAHVDQYVAGYDEDLTRFRNITAAYYRGAQGVVLVYDITNRKSFEKVGKRKIVFGLLQKSRPKKHNIGHYDFIFDVYL